MPKSEKKTLPSRFHETLHPLRKDVAGLDIGAEEIWVDVGAENDSAPVQRFETFTSDLNQMASWLMDCGINSVVMESTSVYWIPACQILEDRGIEVLLVNPRYAKNVSGRKTDALDCQWLRTLHCYGLLPASFRPAPRDCVSAQLLETPPNVDRICGRTYPAHAESDDADEPATASCAL